MTLPALIPHVFDSHTVRAMVHGGQLWLHAGDICAALDVANTSQAVEAIPEQHKSMHSIGLPGSAPWFVTKSGAYRLILKSRKPDAIRFQDWLTDEVIPAIETTGGYGMPEGVRSYLDDMRERLAAADREVEHRTRHDYFRSGSRGEEKRQAAVAQVAAKFGVDPRLVAHSLRFNATDAMAEIVGDPKAIEDRRRVKEALAEIASLSTPKLPKPAKRRRARR